jgi:hypothetical protein
MPPWVQDEATGDDFWGKLPKPANDEEIDEYGSDDNQEDDDDGPKANLDFGDEDEDDDAVVDEPTWQDSSPVQSKLSRKRGSRKQGKQINAAQMFEEAEDDAQLDAASSADDSLVDYRL